MIQPLHNRLLIKPFPPLEKTTAGLFIPDSLKQYPHKATVIAVGKGRKKFPMQFSAGDIVFHVKNTGEQIEVDGELHYLINDGEALCYIPQSE